MIKKALTISCIFLVSACVTVPPNTFVVTPQQLEQRQLETRRYDGVSELDVIVASANVLQDMGFNLENSEPKLGVITANKDRNAVHGGEVAAAIIIALLGGGAMAISKDQKIRVALVVRPVLDSTGEAQEKDHFVRVSFQRVVRRTDNSSFAETLKDPTLFQEFFDGLSKSVFLEAHKI